MSKNFSYEDALTPPNAGGAFSYEDAIGEKPKRTWGEAIKDTGAQLAEGVNTTLGAIPSFVAPQSKVAGFFRDNADYWRDQQSDVLKGRIAETDKRIAEAGKDGVLSQIGTAASEYWNDPAQAARLVATNLPSMAATLGTGAAAGLAARGVAAARGLDAANKAALAAKYGTTTATATNAALNAGGARGEAFEDLQKAAIAQGMTPEQAEQAGASGSILPGVVGGVAGAISGKIGLEKAILGQATTGAAMRKAAGAFGAELAGEQTEELAPKVATNYQVGRIDPGRTLTDDLGRTMVETAIGSGPGAVVAGGAAGMRTGELPPSPGAGDPTTSPGAADPNAPVPPGAAPVEAPDLQATAPATEEAPSPIQPEAVEPAPLTPEQRMAELDERMRFIDQQAKANGWDKRLIDAREETLAELDALRGPAQTEPIAFDAPETDPIRQMVKQAADAGGALSTAAGVALDLGATNAQFLGATGRDVQLRQTGPGVTDESNVIDVDAREVPDQRGIPTARRLTNDQDGGARATSSQTLALPAPTNLREGLERIRAQRQEAARLAQVPPTQGANLVPQATQAVQTIAQQQEAGNQAPVGAAATTATQPGATGGSGVQAAGVSNATTTQNLGAQAAPAAGAQAAPQRLPQGARLETADRGMVQGMVRYVDGAGLPLSDWAEDEADALAQAIQRGRGASAEKLLRDHFVAAARADTAMQGNDAAQMLRMAQERDALVNQLVDAGYTQAEIGANSLGLPLEEFNRLVKEGIYSRERGAPDSLFPKRSNSRKAAAGPTQQGSVQSGGKQSAAAGAQAAAPQTAVARPDGWRKNMLKAAPVAKAMGIDPTGKRLAQVLAEIDARDTQAPATPAPAPQPGPVRLGRDNQPLSEGGKPFKTRKAAGDAKKLQPMMRVVSVEGGYALAEKTPAQLAAEERAAKRLRTPRTSPAGEPVSAHAFIAASGGLHMRHRNDLGVDGNPRIGNRTLFAGQGRGLSIEQATQMLIQDGYLSEGASINDALALIKTSLTRPQYNADGIERIAQAESDARFEDYLAAQEEAAAEGDTDPFGIADEFTAEELDEVGYTSADPALQAEVNALIAQADAMGIDTYAILDDIARTYADATQDEFNAAARDALAQAIARSNQDGGSTAAQAAPAAEPAAEQWLTSTATDRFAAGRSLSKDQRRQVLASLVDVYKTKGAGREFKGLDGNGNERYGYVYSPDLFEKSDITGAMVRYHVTLPDGRIAHPSELFPDLSTGDVERMALEQEDKRRRSAAYDNALKPFYSDFDSANLFAVKGQAVVVKDGRFAIIQDRSGSIQQARGHGWDLASSGVRGGERTDAPAALELAAQTPAEAAAQQDAQEQAAKAEAARQRAADAQAARDEERKRIAQASVRAADTFELGQDPLDSLTGQGSIFDDAPAQSAPTAASDDEGRERFTLSIEMFGDVPYRASKPVDAGSGKVVSSRVITTKTKLTAANAQALGLPKDKGTVYAWRVSVIRRANGETHSVIEAMATDNGRSPDGEVLAHFKEVENPEAMERIAPAIAKAALSDWRAAQPQQAPAATEPVAQPITRADVEAAQQQAAAIITERIDAMTAGEVNTIARRFLPTMGVRPTVSKERNKAAVTDFTKVNPMAAADEFGVTLPADVRRALDAEMQGKVADAGQDDGLAARADSDDDYLRTLFGGSDAAEQDAVSPAQAQKIDAKAAVPMLRKLAQEKRVEAEDWSSRKYKGNKSQVNLRGDGPSNQETMSVSAVNESRRRKAMESLAAQANAADKLADRIESGSINIQSALDNISRAVDSDMKRDGGKPRIGKSRQDMFEGYISSQLLADPYAGYGEGTVSSALRAMYEGQVADALSAKENTAQSQQAEPNPLDYTPKQYADAWLRWAAESNGLPLAEVREMQGDEAGLKAIEQRWVDAAVQEAKNGRPLPAKTLDKLLEVRPNAQLPESAIPDGYQRSQARKQEADEKQARADNRKKVETKEDDTGNVVLFSRSGAQSANANDQTSRSWYDRFVSLLPDAYRNDSHRREPLPAEDWNVQRASEVRSKVEALNKQLRGADDRKGYGPVSVDGLGNLQVDARDVSAADLSGPIRALADELGAGIAATNVRSADARALQNSGFVSESSLAAIADRLMQRPFASPTNNYAKDSAPGTILTYKPRGFPAVLFARSATPPADSNARNVATQMLVDGLKANWTRAPEIIVARNMQDPQVPQAVRDYDETLKSQGATGEARGFIYKGKVYLLSDQLKGPQQIAEVLFHEVLGHYGLRGAFGDSLDTILRQMGTMRRRDVVAKAREYGLFDKDALGGLDKKTASDAQIWAAMSAKDRLSAAEEVLAEMAQTQPTIGFVQRAIAAIRNWLRAHVPGLQTMSLTDADIIQAYILPARGFVTRSKETGAQSLERAMAAFSRETSEAPVDFSSDPRFHELFYGEPTQQQVAEFQRWLDANPETIVRLYHGTAAVNPVEAKGLLKTTASRRNSMQSTSGYVYLSVYPGMADSFARMAAQNRGAGPQGKKHARYAVDMRVAELLPDTDQLRNQRMFAGRKVGNTLAESLAYGHAARVKGNVASERISLDGPMFSRTPGDQTQTEAFKRWFAGSKVVDADGNPLRVYHGTDANITEFKVSERGTYGGGIYLTPDTKGASDYAIYRGDKSPTVYPLYVSIKNPATGAEAARVASWKGEENARAELIARGYDGVIDMRSGEIVAFYPEQVKSAIGNNGDFDPTNPDIRFSRTSAATGMASKARDELANAAGAAIKSITVANVKQRAGFKLTDYLGIGLQALGRRQIVDIYGDLVPLAEYNRLVQQMEADKNEGGAEADKLVTRWADLPDEGKLADLMHDATLAQIDPAKPYVGGDDKAKYAMLAGRFNALSQEAKKVYTDTRDAYQAHHAKVRSAIKERIDRSELKGQRKAELLKQMDDEFFKAVKGVYFPLARFGQYAVTVKGPDGKVESVSRAETKAEAEALRNNLLSAFPRDKGFTVGRVMLSKDFIADRDAVGRGFMTELYQVLDKQDMDAAQRAELEDTLGQLYLSSLPDLSWAKHGIHRKGTPGFSQDARRAFAQNMFHGARYLAKLRYSDLMQDELAAMQKHVDDWREVEDFDQNSAQRVVDEMNKRHESLMNPKSNALSTALTSLGFVFHLGLSPASAMVNLSQTALVAYPIMGAKWGFGKAGAALLKASKQAAAGKNDITGSLNDDEREAYDEAVRAGTIDVTMAHDLAGIAQGEDAGVMWKIRPVMRWASFLFHHAERFNRQVTFVAAYRLAREAGADQKAALEQATKATYDGHFDYSASNRARIMQGNAAKVLLLFKQYGQNMVYTLARNAQQSIKGESPEVRAQARKALGGLLAMHAAAAGVLGLPMVTTLLAAASMIGGDDDEPWDAKVALQNMLADALGQKPAEVLAHGLSRLTPWDISGRVGLDRLIFPDVQEGLEGQRLAESAMAAALGPVAGIGVNMLKGAQHMSEGRYALGLEAMLPSALRGPVKAIRYANEGVQDKSGISILDEVGSAAVAGQALGFSPSQARNAQEGKSAVMAHDRALGERRQELLTKAARATMDKDTEARAEAMKEIQRFNQKNPTRRITPLNVLQSVRNRQKRIDQAEGGVYLPKNRRDAMDAGRFAFAGTDRD